MTSQPSSHSRSFSIGTATITDDTVPYVVAEIGANHQGDMETAKKMIQAAALAGAMPSSSKSGTTKLSSRKRPTTRRMRVRMRSVIPMDSTARPWSSAEMNT